MKADHPKGPGKFYTIAQIAELMDVSSALFGAGSKRAG
jgi:hypothetical protein